MKILVIVLINVFSLYISIKKLLTKGNCKIKNKINKVKIRAIKFLNKSLGVFLYKIFPGFFIANFISSIF